MFVEDEGMAFREEEKIDIGEDKHGQEESVTILDDIGSFDLINFTSLTSDQMRGFEYGRINGFLVRQSKVGRRMKVGLEGEIL
ncbi:hypothetical protein AHAS_Ahas11G0224700 [Arachis hypogaea]